MKNFILGALKSKTMWFNAITLLLAMFALPEFVSLLPVSALPYLAFINGFGNLILRSITSQPLSSKV